MPTHKSYHSYLIESLKDPAEAAYLDAVLEDSDLEHILLALKNVEEAHRGLIDASNESNSSWESCYLVADSRRGSRIAYDRSTVKRIRLKAICNRQTKTSCVRSCDGLLPRDRLPDLD
jgi:DNA-binding phage protein